MRERQQNGVGSGLVNLILTLVTGLLAMIRRLYSTLIDYPAHLTSELFQAGQSSNHSNFIRNQKLDNLSFLFECAPCFPVNARKIRVITEPTDFYETLVRRAKEARDRIGLASLYLGNGKLESDLVKAIQKNIEANKSLKINILLDYARGTRGKNSSKDMLMPLIGSNCNLSLYHSPNLRGLYKKMAPAKYNELLGIQHMKIYLFDDTVVLSGANLSNDYFSNRQDRYIEIEDRRLADFFSSLIKQVQEFSLTVNQQGDFALHENWKLLPYEGDQAMFAAKAKDRIQKFFARTFNEQNNQTDEEGDTWIFPTLEMGQLGIHHDSVVMRKILANIEEGSRLDMATGYFNITQSLMDAAVKDCDADCSVIMAHPNANGFKGSKFPLGGIPDAYSLIARRFLEQIRKHGHEKRISLLEYDRPTWTYHAKGLWYTPADSTLPHMTVIGSSNYGERSVNRDLEAQICLVTTNEVLQKALKAEHDLLKHFSVKAEEELVARTIPRWVRTVVFFFKTFF